MSCSLFQHTEHNVPPDLTSLVCQQGLLSVCNVPEQSPGVLIACHHLPQPRQSGTTDDITAAIL